MAVIHNKKKLRKAADLISQGKKAYAFYRLKQEAYLFLLYIILVLVGVYFYNKDDFWSDLIKYSFIVFIFVILSYFSFKDSFLDLVYDYNETIDYYKSNDNQFFEGLEYKKYSVRFTENSVIITQ